MRRLELGEKGVGGISLPGGKRVIGGRAPGGEGRKGGRKEGRFTDLFAG